MWVWTNTDSCKQKGQLLPLYAFVKGKLCCTNMPIEIYISFRWLTFAFEGTNTNKSEGIVRELMCTRHVLFHTSLCQCLLIFFA